MTNSTISTDAPVRGARDGKGHPDPAVREAWLSQRRGGFTATEARDWQSATKRRSIIDGKVNGTENDLSNVQVKGSPYTLGQYAEHGNLREPIIAQWVLGKYGIEPCSHVYAAGRNPRHLASPDGISLDPFSRELIVGTEDAVLAEIKTSKNDLTPGPLDSAGVLLSIAPRSHFERSNYYDQMQWQMYVMNATATLFVHEQHDNVLDPETGMFTPLGPPLTAWVMRDQERIDMLVEMADDALAQIDAARLSLSLDGLPPTSALPADIAVTVAELLAARDAEAVAKKAKEAAWEKLSALYLDSDAPDQSIDAGFARITVGTTRGTRKVVDEDGMRAKARTTVERYEALRERFTSTEPTTSRRLTVTAQNVSASA